MEEYGYKAVPKPRKKSPFADSPYECVCPMEQGEPRIVESAPVSKPRRGRKIWSYLALSLVVCIVTSILVSSIWQGRMDNMEQAMDEKFAALEQLYSEYKNNISAPLPEEGPLTPSEVYAKNMKAVVTVTCRHRTEFGYGESTGSGFLISADGYVVTNYHVIEGSYQGYVEIMGKKPVEASLVGYDASNDIAVLKVEGENLPYVELGSSDALNVGDQVTVIGNPLGELTSTLTVGYISAKDRIITTDGATINMLQTDAAINAGNSGGPLFNMYGQVVGIITAKYSNNGEEGATIEGLGFAIPIDDVKGMISDLVEYGYITGASLGVMVMDVDAQSQYYGLPAGAYVDSVTPGSAAYKGGVRAGDIITNLGGYDVDSVASLTRALRRFEAGESVSVTVYRNGRTVYLIVELDEKAAPIQNNYVEEPTVENDWFDDLMDFIFGF